MQHQPLRRIVESESLRFGLYETTADSLRRTLRQARRAADQALNAAYREARAAYRQDRKVCLDPPPTS